MDNYIRNNYKSLFEPSQLETLHSALLYTEIVTFSSFSKLIAAWTAFIFGDNVLLTQIMQNTLLEDLKSSQELSLYYGLLALCGDIHDITPEKKLKLAHDSETLMMDQPDDLIYGNALLTLGQVYSEKNDYPEGIRYYGRAKEVFEKSNVLFLTIIAEVNGLLNLFKLGEYHKVINGAERSIRKASCFKRTTLAPSPLFKIYDLPIGMALIELGKYELALNHLAHCKDSIDSLEMFHLHGLLEWSRMKAMRLRKDYTQLDRALSEFRQMFIGLSSPMLQGIGDFYEIMLAYDCEKRIDHRLLERLEHLLEQNKRSLNFILIEMMALLQLSGLKSFYKHDEVEWLETQVMNHGLIPIQQIVKRLKENLHHPLSEREREILGLLTLGESNESIGLKLYITTGTVKWHLNNIYSKLGVKNRIQAIEKFKAL